MPFDMPDQGCEHTHALSSALRGIEAVMHDPRPMTERRGAKNWHYVNCTRSFTARAKARKRLMELREWRRQHPWLLAWERLSPWDRQWADNTASCESGGNPTAHNPTGVYHGAMQFDLGTWAEAGGSGDPHTHSLNEQKVRAVWLMHKVGSGRWPVCGH